MQSRLRITRQRWPKGGAQVALFFLSLLRERARFVHHDRSMISFVHVTLCGRDTLVSAMPRYRILCKSPTSFHTPVVPLDSQPRHTTRRICPAFLQKCQGDTIRAPYWQKRFSPTATPSFFLGRFPNTRHPSLWPQDWAAIAPRCIVSTCPDLRH